VTASPSTGVDDLLRELAPRVLGVLARRAPDFGAAEDAVQEALLAAFRQWPEEGLPHNPHGWLVTVAGRRLTDHVRGDAARRRRESETLPEDDAAPAADAVEPEGDDTLALLFLCCHPALTPPSAIALTLRAVGGLTTAEIARAFLVPEATMAQRISRAKQAIADAGGRFELPAGREWAGRLGSVLQVLYLIFNEGYAASSGSELQRADLADEAIRLAWMVRAALPQEPDATALLALLLLIDARRDARIGPAGELIPLPDQDRGRWDAAKIETGRELLRESLGRGAAGVYQLQAAINALHDEAATAADTDWPQVLALYGVLRRITDNPVVALNEAVAVAMVRGPEAGLQRLAAVESDRRLARSHRLAAVRAHLLELAGDAAGAIAAYEAAANGTASAPERHYLVTRAARLGDELRSATRKEAPQ
jgi:RNA polymerase sigma factor (sigma-70 family)